MFHSGERARMGNTLKIPSPTGLARLGHFPTASQAGRRAGPVFHVYVFSLVSSSEAWPLRQQSCILSLCHMDTGRPERRSNEAVFRVNRLYVE
jgi:hypothetical protein